MRLFYKFVLVLLLVVIAIDVHSEDSNILKLKKMAMNGDVETQFELGSMYDSGQGVKRSRDKALKWYLMAAKNGYAEAQNSLGSAYQAENKFIEARKWYELAATQEHPLAINNLAFLYDLGLGVPQNRKKGFELYLQAADLGWTEAMWNIANMYGAGQLGKRDMYKACIWSVRAKNYVNDSDVRLMKQLDGVIPHLKSVLTNKQFYHCKKEAKNWSPNQK